MRRWTHTRLAALLAGSLLAGSLLGAGAIGAAPAYADGNLSVSVNPGTVNLTVGGQAQTFDVQVKADGGDVRNVLVGVSIPLSNYGVQPSSVPGGCATQQQNTMVCSIGDLQDGATKDLTFGAAPPGSSSVGAGQQQSGTGQVQVQSQGGGATATGSYQMTLTGQGPASVGQVSGSVIDGNSGSAIPGATVTIKDASGHSYTATTDNGGNFMFAPSATQPLAPGTLTVTLTANGYTQNSTTAAGQQGQPVTVGTIQLAKAVTTPSATPSAAPSKTAGAHQTTADAAPKSDSGLGFVTWLLIVLGALLVIGGIIAIVLLLRRKDKGEEGDDGASPMFGPDGGSPPPYGANPDLAATTVLNRVPPGGVSPDAPTMVHNGPLVPPERDEFDDYDNFARNYGTSNYAPGGQRNDQPTQTWQPNGNGMDATRPVSAPGAPGSAPPTMPWRPDPATQRAPLDEPTRGWNPNQDQPTRAAFNTGAPDRYDEPTNGRGGYPEPPNGRGRYDEPTNGAGYGTPGGYGAPTSGPGAGYGGPASGPGYGAAGSPASPYDQPGPHGRHGSPEPEAPLWPDRLPGDAPTSYGQPSAPPATAYGQPSAPPANNAYGQPSGPPANTYSAQPSGPGAGYGAPTSGPGAGYGAPTSGPGYGDPGGRGHGGGTGGGYGRGESTQQWNPNQGQGGQPGQPGPFGQPDPGQSRHRVDDPTRQWNPNAAGRPPSPPPSLDETRLERRDGVDWLDG